MSFFTFSIILINDNYFYWQKQFDYICIFAIKNFVYIVFTFKELNFLKQ